MKLIATMTDSEGRCCGLVHGPDEVGCSVKALGKTWRFDHDNRFGPLWVKRNGYTDCRRQNPPKAVWRAYERWYNRKVKAEKRGGK